MTGKCGEPLSHEKLVAYWANELAPDEVPAIDEHLFGCDACTVANDRMSRIVQGVRTMVPPVVSRAEVDVLRARGLVVIANEFAPGVRKSIRFERDTHVMIHHLGGLELRDAERVAVTVRSESGPTMYEDVAAPFDSERGEVLIACQRHFADMPDDVAFDVRVHRRGDAAPTVTTYFIPHEFVG